MAFVGWLFKWLTQQSVSFGSGGAIHCDRCELNIVGTTFESYAKNNEWGESTCFLYLKMTPSV